MVALPAARPCGSCPYRRDVPSGVWHESEYAKLPPYDRPTGEQPTGLFLCHQQNGRLCAGWVGCHDMGHNLALRFAQVRGELDAEQVEAVLDYVTSTPLFASGREAAAHGMAAVAAPPADAQVAITRLARKRARQSRRG